MVSRFLPPPFIVSPPTLSLPPKGGGIGTLSVIGTPSPSMGEGRGGGGMRWCAGKFSPGRSLKWGCSGYGFERMGYVSWLLLTISVIVTAR